MRHNRSHPSVQRAKTPARAPQADPAPWTRRIGLALLLGGAGCAVGPDYEKPKTVTPVAWNRLDATGARVTVGDKSADLREWWRSFDDPLLSELVSQALEASLDLKQAQARLREVRARLGVAEADRYPSLNATGNAVRNRSSRSASGRTATNSFNGGFDASWELDVFGRVRRQVEAAEADLASTEENLNAARVTLVAEVARTYVEARSLQIRVEIAKSNLKSQYETLQLTEWRAEAGMVGGQDVEQARSNHEQTMAQVPSLEVALAEAQHRLDILLARPPGSLQARLAAGGELPVVPLQIAVGIPADTLRQRPDVRAAERKLAAETARIGIAKAAMYPSFKLSGSVGLEAITPAVFGSSGGGFYSLVGGITAPLFQGGRLRAQVKVQDAVREQALISYQKSILTALQEVEDALVALARNRERREALERAVQAARNAAGLARQRYAAGVIDFQSVLDTERTVRTLEDTHASSRADGVLALVRLYKALGGGWTPPPEPKDDDEEEP